MRRVRTRPGQRGVALLTAMLTVALVATFASAALWQQWRGVEIESAERSRLQMQWVLNGALDWARLILQEDGRDGAVDHLSEPWAQPLQEARLTSFLALDKNNTDDSMDAFLSGAISDQQALLNVRNLVQGGQPHGASVRAFERLFRRLNLPTSQVQWLTDGLVALDAAERQTSADNSNGVQPINGADGAATAPLRPGNLDQLLWLGLPRTTLQVLRPYATFLPEATSVNVNTASADVLYAAVPALDMARAQQMVGQRAAGHFKDLAAAWQAAGLSAAEVARLDSVAFGVGSKFFTVRGRLRLGQRVVQELSLVERNGTVVKVRWRQREAILFPAAASLQ